MLNNFLIQSFYVYSVSILSHCNEIVLFDFSSCYVFGANPGPQSGNELSQVCHRWDCSVVAVSYYLLNLLCAQG